MNDRTNADLLSADLLAFLDGHKSYIEFGPEARKFGSGYITREDDGRELDGWLLKIVQKEGESHTALEYEYDENNRRQPVLFDTLRDALEAAVEWQKNNTPFMREIAAVSKFDLREVL